MKDLKEKYEALSDGKKRKLMQAYMSLFGNRSTFFNKIKGSTRLRQSEILFFTEKLK